MYSFKAILLLTLAAIIAADSTDQNGTLEDLLPLAGDSGKATPNQFPWLATVVVQNPRAPIHVAVGSLISNKHVVTTGAITALAVGRENSHIIFSTTFMRGQKRMVGNAVVHPNFLRSKNPRFNIGVFILRQPIQPSTAIRPIALTSTVPTAGQTVRLVGFGGFGKYILYISNQNVHFWLNVRRPFTFVGITNPLLWANRQIMSRPNCAGRLANTNPGLFLCVSEATNIRTNGAAFVWQSNNQNVLVAFRLPGVRADNNYIKITPHVQWLTQLIRRN